MCHLEKTFLGRFKTLNAHQAFGGFPFKARTGGFPVLFKPQRKATLKQTHPFGGSHVEALPHFRHMAHASLDRKGENRLSVDVEGWLSEDSG